MAEVGRSRTKIGVNDSVGRASTIRKEVVDRGAARAKPPALNGAAPSHAARDVSPQDAAGSATASWLTNLIAADGPGIIRLLWKILHRESDVADAFQETCCKLAGLRNPAGLKYARAYAYRTAANTAIEMLRSRARRSGHFAKFAAQRTRGELEPEGPVEGDTKETRALQAALAELPTHLREVVILRDLGRMPYREVGRLLDIDPATARVYRRHAVVRLAELMHEEMAGAGRASNQEK